MISLLRFFQPGEQEVTNKEKVMETRVFLFFLILQIINRGRGGGMLIIPWNNLISRLILNFIFFSSNTIDTSYY